MQTFTPCLVFLVILATVPSRTQNKEVKPLLKDWFFHMALEDLIEFKTDAEDLMRVAHLPETDEFPHPSIGALLDKSHATYPVQHHCAAPQQGGEMRLMLQLVPKELICREINKVPLEPESSSQLPLEPESSSQLPLEPESSSQLPLEPESSSQLPLEPERSSQLPLEPESTSQLPLEPESTSQLPLEPESTSQLPLEPESTSQLPLESESSMDNNVQENINLDETETGATTEEIETTRTTSNGMEVEEVAEEDLDEGSGIMYSPLVANDVGSSTVEPQTPKIILKEFPTSIVNISIDGLPETAFPTENLLSMTTVEAGPDDPQTLIAALFPSSLWMLTVDTSDEGVQYSYVDHIDFHNQLEDQNAQAVSMDFLPIYLTMDDSPSLDGDGSWENFVMIHKKISPGLNAKLKDPTISPVSQLMEADLALIRVGKNGTFYPFYYSFQAELPWSPVQASLSFTRENTSFVVYATKDTITGYQISQSEHYNKLILLENMDSIALTENVLDMALAQIDSQFFLVVLKKIDNSSTVKVFPFVQKSQLYDLASNSVFEMKMPDMEFSKMKSFRANSTNYIIFASSDSNAALYSIENGGKLIHRQDFSLDEIIDVHFVEVNASSNEDLLIFIQNTGAVVYFLQSPYTWKLGRQVFFDDVLASKEDSNSVIAVSNPEGGLAFIISNSSGSLLQMNLSVGSDLIKSEDDNVQAKTDDHGLEDTKEDDVEANTDQSFLDAEESSVKAEIDQSVLEDVKTDESSQENTTVLEELDDILQPAEVVNNFTLIENEMDEVTNENDLEELTNIVESDELMDNSTNKEGEDFDQYSQNEDTTISYKDSTTTVINEMNVEHAPEALHLTSIVDSHNEDNEAENTERSTSVNSVDFNNSEEDNTEVTTTNSVENVQNEQRTTKQPKDLKLLETEEKHVLVKLIRILKFLIYLSKDDSAEAVNGLKPLIGLLKDVKDHEELKQADYASSIVNVIADLEYSQDNEKVTWDAENVKKLELVLNIVADIVNKVERPHMTEDRVIQLLEEIKSTDQFSSDTEAIEYAIQSLKEHRQLNVSKVESKQTDVILLKINFILNGRDVKSLNKNDLKNILQELKPLTKYNGQELEMVQELVNELSYLEDQQKDWINEKLSNVNKNGLVDVSSLREVVSKMEEDLKKYEGKVSERKEDLFPDNSTVIDIISSDDDDEDASNTVEMLNNYVEELRLLDAQVTEEAKSEAFTKDAIGAEPLIAYNSTAEETINSDDNEADEMIELLTGYVEDLKSREAQDLSATTARNFNEDRLEIKSSTETASNSEDEEDRVNGLISDKDGDVPPDSKFSEDADWCSRGHNCHPFANCENGENNYTCLCKNGFQGNGTHCEEVVPEESATTVSAASSQESATTISAASSQEAQVVILKDGQESVTEEQVELSNLLLLIKRFRNYIEEKEFKINGQKLTEIEEVLAGTDQEPIENEEKFVGTEQEGGSDERKLEALTIELEEALAQHEETLAHLEKDSTRLINHGPIDEGKEQATSLSQSEKLRLLTELINALRIYAEKMETEASKMVNKDISTGNDEISTGDENKVFENQTDFVSTQSEEGSAQFIEMSTESEHATEEGLVQFEDTLTQWEHTSEEGLEQVMDTSRELENTTEGLEQYEDTSTQSEHTTEKVNGGVLSESKEEEVRAFVELTKKFRIYIEKIETEAKAVENDPASTGLWPLIEHLRKVSTLKEVNKALNMSEEVDNLIEQLKQADQHFANASWDAKKLDMVLDKERELIENKTSETVEEDIKAGVSSEVVNGKQNQEEPDTEVESFVKDKNENEGESSGTMSDGEDGELQWLIEGLNSTKVNGSILSKVKKADQTKTSDLELLKEILRDLEHEKEMYESSSMGTSNENLPESRSLTDSSGRGAVEDESIVDDEDLEATIESHVEELESQVEELKSVVEQALDQDDRKNSTNKIEEETPDSKEAEGSDWCSRYDANCHPNAECLNGASNYTCRCKNGFEGNGTHCQPAGDLENTTREPEENANTTEANIEGVSVNHSKLATNDTATNDTSSNDAATKDTASNDTASKDTATKDTASLELKELIFDWREKFFIILAFFILFAVLFLIIIAVLIYKMKQSGEYAPIDAPNVGPSD